MNLSELCIRRPVFTTLVTATFIVAGIFGYRLLSVAALPAVDFPTIAITATLPGASAETMAASVAAPIERQMSTISGITSLTSSSALGFTQIVVQFDLNRNIDGAAQDVQSALTIAQRRLPVEMTTPPGFRKVNPGDFPVLFLSLSSATLPLSTVDEYAEVVLGQQISQIPGVAQVQVFGAQKFAVRVQVDPVAAAARNVSLDEVRAALGKANSNSPVGTLVGPSQTITLRASAAIEHAADYRSIVVKWVNGAPVKLSEIARVVDGVENNRVAGWYNDERSIILAIQRRPDANTVAVVDAVREKLPSFRAQVPAAVQMAVLNDRSASIREAVEDVQVTLVICITLVVLVIFLFLRSVVTTLIPFLAVPVSIIGTCASMYLLGFSINNMTLLALTLSVGFVVDDAIVMLENIVRHVEGGMRPFEAALKGSKEIAFTIMSISFALVAVFIPVLLMGGIVGRLFREFAVTIVIAICTSAFVSLTLTPMLCARILKGHHEGEQKREFFVLRAFAVFFQGMQNGYELALKLVLAHKPIMLVVTFVTLFATVGLYVFIPKGFFPIEDTGFITATTEGPSDVSIEAMSTIQRKVSAIVMKDSAVAYINSSIGPGGFSPSANYGRIQIALKPKGERKESATDVIQRLRRTTNTVPGVRVTYQNVQNLNITGRPSRGDGQYTLQSSDTEVLYRVAEEMRDKIAKIGGLRDVTTDLSVKNPQMMIDIDREKAAVYGITVDQIRQELFNAFGQRQVGTIFSQTNDYQIILESMPEYQVGPADLSRIFLKTNGPTPVPIDAVARLIPSVGPVQVNHQGNQPSVTISFNLAPGFALGQATDAIRDVEANSRLPATITSGFQGTAQVFEDSKKGQGALVLAAIFAAYVLLGILYESFIHPITIISGLPSAGVGALLTLMAFNMDLSVIAMIGIVMLVGIVMKNAIIMVDFAVERRHVGLSAAAAMTEAASLRFRPIMMTTFAAIFGTLPIALGTGAGAELRQPLGIAVVGGLCLSQLLTLFITPVIYVYLDGLDRRLRRGLYPQVAETPAGASAERPHVVAAE